MIIGKIKIQQMKPLVNRTLTPPEKGGSQWDEQERMMAIAFKIFVSQYMNGEITEEEPNKNISDDDLWDLFIQQNTKSH